MKYLSSLILISVLLSSAGCKKESMTNDLISIRAKATYGGQPLVFFQPVDYPQGFKIKIETVDFMIKGFNLSGAVDNINTNDSVFVIKFSDTNLNAIGATNGIIKSFAVNKGSYSLLNFGIGVDSLTNKKNPSNFPSSSILSDSYYYWDAWKSFVFMKVEGSYDADGDGIYEGGFAYHTGTSNLFKLFNLPVNLTAKPGSTNEIVLNFDIRDVLAADNDYIDMKLFPSSHNPKDIAISQKIFAHLSKAVSVK